MPVGNDVRYGLRTIRRNPAFSLIAIATLAFGIGANTAIFSVVDAVLIRPLGYAGESRMVAIHEEFPKLAKFAPRLPVNAMHFLEWRKTVRAFDAMAMIGGTTMNLTGNGEPQTLVVARTTPGLFPMLGARTQLGRTFLEEEDQAGRDNVVVLSDELWKSRFASDRNIVGRKILLDNKPYEVIGVLAPSFHFPELSHLYAMTIAAERPQLWKPFAVTPNELAPWGDFNYACVARLRPGVSLGQAYAELNAAQAHIASLAPEKLDLFAALVPLQDQITGRSRSGLLLVLSAVGLVLLIGCINIANLLLARATSRKPELAIRSALGAGGGRLLRQIMTECLLLAGIGGALGAGVAYGALRVIVARAPVDLPRLDEVHPDARVLLFTLGISVFAGLLFGLLPALRLSGIDPNDALKSGGRGTEARGSGRLRTALVALEVGLSTLCLIPGGLLLRSFVKLLEVDKGFAIQQVVTVNLNLPASRYPDQPERVRFTRSLLESLRNEPGVISAGMINKLPLSGEGGNNIVSLEGTNVPFMERPLADIRGTNPEYFRTMGIPLRQGRIFEEADGDRLLVEVSSITAERLWPGQNPLGKRLRIGDPGSAFWEVVGVVGDVRGVRLDKAPSVTIYVPYWQRRTWSGPTLVVRTAMDPLAIATPIRNRIRDLDPELPVPRFETMQQIVDESLAQRRFQMKLILLFGLAALALASLGIYGVVSYSVAVRTNEMGIRMALGAGKGQILQMVLRQAMAPVIAGLGCGLIASLVAGRFLAGLLYGVAPRDIVTINAVVVTLVTVAALATLIPAQRATRIEPMVALRYE